MFKTVFLGLLVNIAIMGTLSIILKITGLDQALFQYLGGGYPYLFSMCLFWGMGGAFISLLMSKWIAKTFNHVQVLSVTGPQGDVVRMVHSIAQRAGMTVMPEVGIYQSPDVNAFATGSSKNNSLVALSTGLLNLMDRDEVEGVIGHEISHIVNGDMVTMTVVQGVVNAFVMFFAFIVTQIISNALRSDNDDGPGLGFFAQFFVRQALMGVFGMMAYPIVAGFSRYREYKADAGAAKTVGAPAMIKALTALKRAYPQLVESKDEMATSHATMNISSKINMVELFSTHPTLDKRIERLRSRSY